MRPANDCKVGSSRSEICTLVNFVSHTNGWKKASSRTVLYMLMNMVRPVIGYKAANSWSEVCMLVKLMGCTRNSKQLALVQWSVHW